MLRGLYKQHDIIIDWLMWDELTLYLYEQYFRNEDTRELVLIDRKSIARVDLLDFGVIL